MEQLFQTGAFERIAEYEPWTERLSYLQNDRDWMSAVQYCDLNTYLPLDILTKVDRMTMAHSIEARPPLLDHRLVEFAARIPARLRLRESTTKYVLKEAMRGVLPDDIIDRRKQGFAVPLAKWFRGELLGFARDILISDTCRQRGFFDVGYVERLLRLNQRGRDLDLHLWTILSFELWCRRFLDVPLEAPKVAA
jgi:asparagine synthase (glutamine-hydrolysing)